MDAVVLRPGEGESLFGGRIVLKATFEQLCITESHFPDARDGAEPHFHRQHVDSFYVLEGGLAVLVHDEEKLLEPILPALDAWGNVRLDLLRAEHAHQRAVLAVLTGHEAWPAGAVVAGRTLALCDDPTPPAPGDPGVILIGT